MISETAILALVSVGLGVGALAFGAVAGMRTVVNYPHSFGLRYKGPVGQWISLMQDSDAVYHSDTDPNQRKMAEAETESDSEAETESDDEDENEPE